MDSGTVRRLSAILAADVVGYSRMMGEDEARTLHALRRLRDETLAPAVAVNGGRIVKGLGDGWLVAFDSSAAAVLCATSVQDSLREGAPMRLRIGIHIGDVTFADGDIYGDGVNVAARLEAIATPGGLAISEMVWSSLDGTLRSRFTDCGPQQLKNIASAVRVWAQGGIATLPEHSAPPPAGEAGRVSMAVAPFSTSTGDADHVALALGIAEDLETELSRFRWLDVSRPDDNAGARYVLGGAVRGSGHRLRLTAHLTYAPTGRRFWSERWDRTIDDIFAVQDELAIAIVACVSPEIDAHEKSLIGARPVHVLSAHELGLRANAILSIGELDGFDQAQALVARAITLEPDNPQAHTQKALIAYRKACSGAWPPREQLQIALAAAREALRFDQRMASPYGMLSVVHAMLGETDRALDAADRIASLNPNAWGAPHGRSVALSFAPPDWVTAPQAHAAALIEQADATLRMAPRSAYRSGHLFFKGLGLLLRDEDTDLTDAINALDRSATEPGASWWPSLFMALAELRRGGELQARERMREARERYDKLSLQVVDALFDRTFLASRWRDTFDRLPDIGLPRR